MKLDGNAPLHRALEEFYGEQDPVPAERTADGRPGRRAAWRCPACDPTGEGPYWLTVSRNDDGDPPKCVKRCSEAAIWNALERRTSAGSARRQPRHR